MSEGPAPATHLGEQPFPYCKGCGHGLVARRLNEALVRLALDPADIVLTSDIGCVGLVDPLFPRLHTVHTIHGRSTAVAAGAVLADAVLGQGRMKNVVMIGDGGATIGLLHLAQAALMNVDLTVLLHNNLLYGMTGGQHSAFSPEGFLTTTTPRGNWIPALDMEPFLRGCHGGFFARQLATDRALADVIAEAIRHPGFALVEILELCPGYGVPLNRMDGASLRSLAAAAGQECGIRIQRTDRRPFHEAYRQAVRGAPPAEEAPPPAGEAAPPAFETTLRAPVGIILAGSAGERTQTAAAILCQAAILTGLHCTQKNDYPVTVGTGFSVSEVILSPRPILYTGIDAPDAILVTSADGLRELRGRGVLGRPAGARTLIADESLAGGLAAERPIALPLRRDHSPALAALGAVAALAARTGIVGREALRRATGTVLGARAEAALAVVERGWLADA